MAEWGPLQLLQTLLDKDAAQPEGEKDRKQTDLTLVRALSSDEGAQALKWATLDQIDLALAHEALTVERKPSCVMMLLSTKASKLGGRQAAVNATSDTQERRARFLQQISQFLYQVPVSVAAKEIVSVSALVGHYARIAEELKQSIKTIYPLKSFLRRFHQHGHTALTPMHSKFLYLCLLAKCYSAAMELLDQPLFDVHAQPHLVSCVDFLKYSYYGALLYIGQKRFQEAMDFLVLTITAPAISLSAFVIDAYKKLVLVSFILNGETASLPKYTPFVVTRHVEAHCTAYTEFSHACVVLKDAAMAEEVLAKHLAVFTRDSNLGLVKQCLHALKQQKLLQLTRTYVTIALPEMTKAAGFPDDGHVGAEKMLLELVAQGRMRAVMDKQKHMVKFLLDDTEDVPDDVAHRDAMVRLQQDMEKILLVSSHLRALDAELVTSAKFQSRVQKDKDRRMRLSLHSSGQSGEERMDIME